MRFSISLLLLVLLVLPGVLAIGISPPSARVDFVPSKTYEFQVRVINYNDFPISVTSRADGTFDVEVGQPIKVGALSSAMVPVKLMLPEKLDRPGYHTTAIFFSENYADDAEGSFSARTEVGLQITVWEPYPGSYAEVTAFAPDVGQGNNSLLTTRINNLGTEDIQNGKITVKIYSPQDELKNMFTYTELSVPGNSNYETKDNIPSRTYMPGRYSIQAQLDYNGKVAVMNSSFIVGTQDVDIMQAEGPIYLDKPVNKYSIHIQSLWNLPLNNVYAVFHLGNTQSTTPSISLRPFEKTALTGYWETDKTVTEGQTNAMVSVYFDGKQKDTLLPIQVYNETPAPIGATVEEPTIILSAADIIFMILAVLIVAAIVIFAFERHIRPKKPQ